MGPTLGFDTKQRNSLLIKFVFFTIKARLTIMRKLHLNDEFLVLLGHIISRFFTCSNEEKINQNNKGCVLLSYLCDSNKICTGHITTEVSITTLRQMGAMALGMTTLSLKDLFVTLHMNGIKVAEIKVYLRQNQNNRPHAVTACIGL